MRNKKNEQGEGRPEKNTRLIKKILSGISEIFKDANITAKPVTDDFVIRKLKKRNRVFSNANIKDRMYRNDELRAKARAKRRAFYFN